MASGVAVSVAFACLLLVCSTGVDAISRPSSVTLTNNEYHNILVAISPDVPEDANLLQKIQDVFTKASAYLYEATQKRAVFRDVTILVPNSWSVNLALATSHVFGNADFVFSIPVAADAPDDPAMPPPPPPSLTSQTAAPPDELLELPTFPRDAAGTKSYAGCGHPGVRVSLTTDVITNSALARSLGPPERVLVHEWASFRWGVFDEYGLQGEPQFYFSPKTGVVEGVRCTEKIEGIIYKINPDTGRPDYCHDVDAVTGVYPDGCEFHPYPGGPKTTGLKASIMDHVLIPPIASFCDDNEADDATVHNYDAPSRHNRLCGHRSTWAVISESEDFQSGKNPPRDGVATQPVFNLVKAPRSRRLILALDTSASMQDFGVIVTLQDDNKLTRARQAAGTFVKDGALPATEIGLTTLSATRRRTRRAPVALNTSADRQSVADNLPDTVDDVTNITLALHAATQILQDAEPPLDIPTRDTAVKSSSLSHGGGHVVVVTDGQETTGPDLKSALPLLHGAGVVVSFVVLGGPPHPDILHLAQATGGRVYCDNNHPESTAITDAFFDLLGFFDTGTPTAPIQLLSRASGLDKDRFMEGEVTVDQDVGNRTTFLVTYTRSLPHVQVVSPSGRVYSHLCPEYSVDTRLQVVKILIPKLAEIGRWRYKVTNPGTYQVTSLQVLSSPANASVLPARLSGSLVLRRNSWPTTINIFAEVTKGRKPVTDLKVTATVRFPYGQSVKIDLMDNGAGADIVEGDGVYSRYFSRFTAPGVYTVTLSATGHTDSLMRFVERTAPAGHFVLHPNMSHSRTRRDTGSDDTEAPVRISDLRVVKTSAQHRTVELSWTASGDDTDHETASEYEILIAPSTKDLMTRSSLVQRLTQDHVTHGVLTAPKPFGDREHVTIRLPQAPGSPGIYVISVVAVDDAGNKGDHSNYVTVGLGKVPDVTDPGNWQDDGVTSAEPETPRDETLVILAIVATVFALLVLIILVSLTVCITLRKKTAEPSSVQNSKGFDLEAVKDGALQNP